MKKTAKLLGLVMRGSINFYRYSFAYFLGGQCRFLPTCSAYAEEAIRLHGPVKGGKLAFQRLCRCHPWQKLGSGEGFDPVPPRAN